ncbi:MAG TPA: PEP/pyruvate-binding domain-containing protein [Bryobacterales bacterium]|nr:PEP/pyruvate-binding domain-containing protein [Bryobacterales bacterium]
MAAICLPALGRAEGLLPPLDAAASEQARKILAGFKANPKGPYFQIRWFCGDGSVLPPGPPPCGSRGGGNEHAELSAAARKLASWNLDVDTILTGLSFEQFLDAARGHHRLKELVLHKYLVEVDDGWIYRRAQYYRGARQVEDEEKIGRRLLAQLFSDPAWVGRNYFLANQLAGAVPHGARNSRVDKIRALAKSIADHDRRFEPIRVKIHNAPGPEDLPAVEKFIAERNAAGAVQAQLAELAGLLKQQQENRSLAVQLPALQKKLAGSPLAPSLDALAAALGAGNTAEIFAKGAAASLEIRRQVTASADGRRNLELLDLNALLLEEGFRAGASRSVANPTRRQLLAGLLDNARYAAGAGLLSLRELDAARGEIKALEKSNETGADAYYQSIRYLARSAEWCRATAAKDFGPLVRLYEPVEPLAGGLVDHLVRGSAALPLASRLEALLNDANRAVGIRHSILGQASSRGIVGLNPGVALGKLGIVSVGQEDAPIDPRGIYVIPETVADIQPMAGILTLDSGNALSHAQLLAANLGIPNATVPSALLPLLKQHAGEDLFFAVTPRRVVVLEQRARLNEAERKLWAERPAANKARFDLDTRRLNLSERRILDLTDLSASDAGVKAGPKAANLAQLAHYFPQNVAPGLVVPFGIYYQHIDRALDASGVTLRQEISQAYAEAERLRAAGETQAEIGRFIYPKLAQFRKTIETMPLLAAFEKELSERMRAKFGPEGSYGLFVRSDTNAEDLPDFAGAGLNLTVPNQVGSRNIVQALKDVWASPFTERAYDWRSRILRSSESVYPSVVLLRTVASEKSGVIGTMNLETGNTGEITVNVNEGISAVVDGGVAESLLLRPNGEVRLLDQARAPYKKVALAGGGLENRPSSGDDFVLQPGEIVALRKMVAEVKARYPAARNASGQVLPWDIEFGFEKGQLRLFQIRPLVRYQELKTLEALSRLEGADPPRGTVRMDERVEERP